MVDVRDLVAFYLKLLEERRGGTYNAAGPREALTMEGFLDQAIKALASTSRLVWIDDYEFLKAKCSKETTSVTPRSRTARRSPEDSRSDRWRRPSRTRWRGEPRCPRNVAPSPASSSHLKSKQERFWIGKREVRYGQWTGSRLGFVRRQREKSAGSLRDPGATRLLPRLHFRWLRHNDGVTGQVGGGLAKLRKGRTRTGLGAS